MTGLVSPLCLANGQEERGWKGKGGAHAGLWASSDQAAVDAARAQSPLQRPLLPLGGEDGDDGLVEHRLQALLRQGGALHVATRANLNEGEEPENKPECERPATLRSTCG